MSRELRAGSMQAIGASERGELPAPARQEQQGQQLRENKRVWKGKVSEGQSRDSPLSKSHGNASLPAPPFPIHYSTLQGSHQH